MGPSTVQEQDLLLSIGAVVGAVSFAGAPQPFVTLARTRYDAFTMPPAPGVARAFSLALRFAPPSGEKSARFDEAGDLQIIGQPLNVKAPEKTIRIERSDFPARLTAETVRGHTRWTGSGRCELNPYSLDSLLRVLYSVLLPHQGGALVHSCGL